MTTIKGMNVRLVSVAFCRVIFVKMHFLVKLFHLYQAPQAYCDLTFSQSAKAINKEALHSRFLFSLNCLQSHHPKIVLETVVSLTKIERNFYQEQEGGGAPQHAVAAGKRWSSF